MKAWTTGYPRDGHAVLPGQMDAELAASRASISGLDRTQLPEDSFDEAEFALYAKHRVWHSTFDQQTNVQDTDIAVANAWEAYTARLEQASWMTAASVSMPGHKGGNIMFEWAANTVVSTLFVKPNNTGDIGNPAHVGVRIICNGVTVAERIGPWLGHGYFRLIGSQQMPAGDLTTVLQWRVTPGSKEDPQESVGGSQIMRAHLFGSKFFAIGRFR